MPGDEEEYGICEKKTKQQQCNQNVLTNQASKCMLDIYLGKFIGKVTFTVLVLLGLGHGLPVPGPLHDKDNNK